MYSGLAERNTSKGDALPDLLGERVRAAERVARRRLDSRQHLGQRRGGEHDRPLGAPSRARAAQRRRATRERRAASEAATRSHRSTITLRRLDDAGGAHARLQPELLCGLARDDRDDARRPGDVDLDLREQPLHLTERTTPRKRLRAEICSEPSAPLSRSTSDADTTRRFAASRSTRIFPARSQRRSVSSEMPSARAASAAGRFCLGIA